MYTRILTFRGVRDIAGGLEYLRHEVMPVLDAQRGFRGISASADRDTAVLGTLSLWETEAARAASDSALGKARDEAAKIVGGELTVENFEELVVEISKPPVAGCSVIVTRLSMDPASIEDNLAYFKADVLPMMRSQPRFCAMRNMIDRQTGRAVVGTVWEDRAAMDAFAANVAERRAPAVSRGITFDETSYRELLLAEMR